MLSYRHSFHAGNFADVLKHALLVYVLDYMNRKEKPYCYIDTHSGAGLYRLDGPEATKTGEYLGGIARLQQRELPPILASYWSLVQSFNPSPRLMQYPGSPAIAQRLLRGQDRAQLSELHSNDFSLLQETLGNHRSTQVVNKDGLSHLIATLPPREKRAVVLIDPSYEIKSDYDLVVKTLSSAVQRFATGTYMIWYPVITRPDTEAFIKALVDTGIPDILRVELCVRPDDMARGMTGSGVVIVNPPYCLKDDLEPLLPELQRWLIADDHSTQAPWQITQLRGER